MVCTGLDIAQVVGVVSKYMMNLGRTHWTTMKWIFRYMRGIFGAIICYNGQNLNLVGFMNADFVGDRDRRRAITG